MAFLLAIDAGTGSCRAVLFAADGTVVASAGNEWQVPIARDGAQPMDTERGWSLIADAIRQTIASSGIPPAAIEAVSAASARGGIVLLDAERRPLWACGAMDGRAASLITNVRNRDPERERRDYRRTGQTLATGAAPRLAWIRKHRPDVAQRTASLAMWSDWVLTELSGEVSSSISNACTTGLVDLAGRRWLPDVLDAWGVPPDLLPPLVEAGTVVGAVTPAASEKTGLAPGTPVVMGGGDTQLAAVGIGVIDAGQTAIVGGSFWQQLVNLASPVTDDGMRVRVTCHAIPGLWQAETLVFGAGLAVRWFRDAFGADLGDDAYARLDDAASSVPPGSEGCLAILSNAMDYGRWRHAAPSLLGLPLGDPARSRAIVYRALLEAAAFAAVENVASIAESTGVDSDRLVVGGGVTRSPLWCQIVADVSDRDVYVAVTSESTALGTAICAGVGVGTFPSLTEGSRRLAAMARVHRPEPAAVEAYRNAAGRWRAAYDRQLELAAAGIVEPMWSAPGEALDATDGRDDVSEP